MSEHRVLDKSQFEDTERFTRRQIASVLGKSERQIQRDLAACGVEIAPYSRFTRQSFFELCTLIRRKKANRKHKKHTLR